MFRRPSDLALSIAAATLFIGVNCFNDGRDDRAFDLYGKTALAQPVSHVRAVPYERGGTVRRIDYSANLTFTTASGETVTARDVRVTGAQRDTLLGGGQLVLQYLPGDPTTVRFPGWAHQSSQTTWTLLLVGVVSSAAFWFLRRHERRIFRAKYGPRKYDGPLRPGDPRP